jgi:hypothetical protein
MEPNHKKREFSMKYCPGLEDHVVVMTTEDQKSKNKICLSSHLCRTDERLSCGHERPSEGKRGEGTFF